MNDKVTRDNRDAADEVVGQGRRGPEQLHFALANTAGAVACGLSTVDGSRVFWTSDRNVLDRAGLAACQGCKAALDTLPAGVCVPGCVLCADAAARWARDNQRAPTLTAKGMAPSPPPDNMHPSHDWNGMQCSLCGAPAYPRTLSESCVKAAEIDIVRAAFEGRLPKREAEDREALAAELYAVHEMKLHGGASPWNEERPVYRESFRAVADYILARFPVPALLSTDGDQAKDSEIQALRKALADAEDDAAKGRDILRKALDEDTVLRNVLGCNEESDLATVAKRLTANLRAFIADAYRDADVYRRIRILTGSSFVTEGVVGAVERVVNERETWRVRALNAEKDAAARDDKLCRWLEAANRAEDERNAATARAEEAEYLLNGARKKLAEVERERDSHKRAEVYLVGKLNAIRNALRGALS